MKTKKYTVDDLPNEYPEDVTLLIEIEQFSTGAKIHEVGGVKSSYTLAIELYRRDKTIKRWRRCIETERTLRGMVAELKSSRRHITTPWEN